MILNMNVVAFIDLSKMLLRGNHSMTMTRFSPSLVRFFVWNLIFPAGIALSGWLIPAGWAGEPSAPLHGFGVADSIGQVEVGVAYYLPRGRIPLPDWRERVEYHMKRAQSFHHREFGKQSKLTYRILEDPFVASASRDEMPKDDVDQFFWHIVNEVWNSGKFTFSPEAFPIILVLSDVNFSPGYGDWTRECDGIGCPFSEPHTDCAGHVTETGEDRPGTRCGGARALIWPERHIGLALVTADGWRVPITGTDCVVYHEGVGHSLGLPHPEPLNDSVMGLAQYVHPIHKSWIDADQKEAMGWVKHEIDYTDLFSSFEVSHAPSRPGAQDTVTITVKLPEHFAVQSILLEYQTGLWLPFRSARFQGQEERDGFQYFTWTIGPVPIGQSIAYRARVATRGGQQEEFWNYYKVRGKE